MTALYITSPETFSGKSALCVGLGRQFQRDGLTVGYMKPVSTTARRVAGQLCDEDAEFMKRMLNLSEPLDILAPICLEPFCIEAALKSQTDYRCQPEGGDYFDKVAAAFSRVSEGKDVVILEGGSTLTEGSLVGLPSYRLCKLLEARVLVVAKYSSDLVADEILGAKRLSGECMIGCVINSVPARRMAFVEEAVIPFLEERRIRVFGALPQERLLLSVSVGELADALGGEILCAESQVDELVENVMIGAMSVDSALTFFRRKLNKAVITSGDRPDIQLAALETSTKCLILTGNLHPSPIILNRAEELDVPMILVSQDTMTAMQTIEQFFGKSRFHQRKKVLRFERLLSERFDFAALYESLGLEPKS